MNIKFGKVKEVWYDDVISERDLEGLLTDFMRETWRIKVGSLITVLSGGTYYDFRVFRFIFFFRADVVCFCMFWGSFIILI